MTLFRGSGEVGSGEQIDYLRSKNNLSDVDNVPEARQNLGLDSLSSIAGLTPTDSTFIVGDGVNWVNESGATARSSLGLTIGADVQSHDAGLDDISALVPVDSNFIVGDGTNWTRESGATARTSLGLGNAATTDILDEDNMVSDSATEAPSQQSVVRYNENLYNRYVAGTNQYPSIQSAIDAVVAGGSIITNLGIGEVYVPTKVDAAYVETVTIPTGKGGMRLRGQGIATYIQGSGDHALTINEQDNQISGFWIDQVDSSGSFDGIHIATGRSENRIDYVDVDAAPRNGIYVNGGRCDISNSHVIGGDVIAVEVDVNATRFRASNLYIGGVLSTGLYLRADHFMVSGLVVTDTGGNAIRIDGSNGLLNATVFDTTGNGIRIDGDNNVVNISLHNTGTNCVIVNGNNNSIYLNASGSSGDTVVINSGATGNRLFGYYDSILDNGTGTIQYN